MSVPELSETNVLSVFRPLMICWIAGLSILHANLIYGQSEATPLASSQASAAGSDSTEGEWIQLFTGRDINDWIVKLSHHDVNYNYQDTFRLPRRRRTAQGPLR